MDQEKLITQYLESGILISPSVLPILESFTPSLQSPFIVESSDTSRITLNHIPIAVHDFEHAVLLKEKYGQSKLYLKFIDYINDQIQKQSSIPHVTRTPIIPTPLTTTSTPTPTTPSMNKPAVHELEKSSPTISPSSQHAPTIITHTPVQPVPKPQLTESSTPTALPEDDFSDEVATSEEIIPSLPQDPEERKQIREAFLKEHRIRIVEDYHQKNAKWTVNDFVKYFNIRFKELEKILRSRQELQQLTSIGRLIGKKDREQIALIGTVYEKSLTKNNNIMFTLEDPTGMIKVVVSKSKEELYALAEEIQLDEVIGITGTYDTIVFASNILLPDIPLSKELKKSPEEGYFAVIADTQFGNKLFLEKEFKKFIAWIRGEVGSEAQREIARQIKYLFVPGDLVEGVGIYPDQEYHLAIIDIYDQYRELAKLFAQIPMHIPVIITPGNHDVGRISEPQPRLDNQYTAPLTSIPNIISVSNPALINIYAQPENGFDGFNVLLYHGYSFIYYAEHLKHIRQKGAMRRPDLVMRYLLQRRHLAPTHTSSLYIPDPKRDSLVIDKVPDFFFSGHVHRALVNNYRNVTCINASCWSAKSPEEERRGLEPQPGRAFIINMQTREVKVMNFLSKEDQEKEEEQFKSQTETVAEPAGEKHG